MKFYECEFIERKPGEWYYILESRYTPANRDDWRNHATAYGPYDSQSDAAQALKETHNVRVSMCVVHYPDYRECELYTELFHDAIANSTYLERADNPQGLRVFRGD